MRTKSTIAVLETNINIFMDQFLKSLDGPEGVLLSEGEELGEVDGESFIYRLIKVIIDVQGI